MNKPLLPAGDTAGAIREAAFAALVRHSEPVSLSVLARLTGLDRAALNSATHTLAADGWLDVDDAGRVTGAAGLSLAIGPHRLTLSGAPFRTWCAYDALGIAAALEADGLVETACGHCSAPIVIKFRHGLPDRPGPEQLWLADGGADLRGSFCTPTVLLCGPAHGAEWAQAKAGQGELLDLDEGARRGGSEWAGCADAARLLA